MDDFYITLPSNTQDEVQAYETVKAQIARQTKDLNRLVLEMSTIESRFYEKDKVAKEKISKYNEVKRSLETATDETRPVLEKQMNDYQSASQEAMREMKFGEAAAKKLTKEITQLSDVELPRLQSELVTALAAKNKTGDFWVRLPHPLRLSNGEVALAEVMFPYSWGNLPDSDRTLPLSHTCNCIELYPSDAKPPVRCWVTPGQYGQIDHLIAAMMEAMALGLAAVTTSNLSGKTLTERVTNEILQTEAYFKALVDKVGVTFEWKLQKCRIWLNTKHVRSVRMSPHLLYILGFESDTEFREESTLSPYPPDLRAGIDSLFIYSNLVQDQFVGNRRVPLLRTVPVSGKYGDIVHQLFQTPHYVPLLHDTISDIQIRIEDDRGRPIPFAFGKSTVKLHFKRARRML